MLALILMVRLVHQRQLTAIARRVGLLGVVGSDMIANSGSQATEYARVE
jgi:hypothetical protein